MKYKFIVMLLMGYFLYGQSCQSYNASKPMAISKKPDDSKLLIFADTLLIDSYQSKSNSKTTLRPQSKIKSVHVEDASVSFNIGLIDFDGDGNFKNSDVDLLTITTGQNYQVRINAEHGTPHCKMKDSLYISVDTFLYLLYNINRTGINATLKNITNRKSQQAVIDVSLKTYCRGVTFKKYIGGDLSIDSVIQQKEYTYLYFWINHKIEYQINKLDSITTDYKSKVNIIGVHVKDHELDKTDAGTFLELLSLPWNGAYCTLRQYNDLNQDFSWYRGMLLSKDGKIIFPHYSPKELKAWLDKKASNKN